MASFLHFLKSLLLPALLAALLYFLTTLLVLPFYRRHHARYAQYLPLSNTTTTWSHPTTSSWRTRISSALLTLFAPASFLLGSRRASGGTSTASSTSRRRQRRLERRQRRQERQERRHRRSQVPTSDTDANAETANVGTSWSDADASSALDSNSDLDSDSDSDASSLLTSEQGEGMIGFDPLDSPAASRRQRSAAAALEGGGGGGREDRFGREYGRDQVPRLARELEVGFRDESSSDEEEGPMASEGNRRGGDERTRSLSRARL